MPLDAGFDDSQQNYALIDQIQVAAWDGKESLVKAPTLHTISLHGLTEDGVVQVPHIGGNRIAIPMMAPGLSFDSMNLLTGILAGDFVPNEEGYVTITFPDVKTDPSKHIIHSDDEVKVYYPHVRDGKLKGKTVIQMSLSEAATLLKKTAAAHEVDINLVKQAVSGMATRFTMYGESQFQLHNNDIGLALSQNI
jgi:hypothetical protein